MNKYIRTLPPLTLFGGVTSSTTKELYGKNDGSGLSPTPRTFDLVVGGITTQTVGDDNIGSYSGFDINVGDYVSNIVGTVILKITSISSKSANGFTCVVEDVGMAIARTRSVSNPNALTNGTSVVIFRVNNDNKIILSSDTLDTLTRNNAIDGIQSYLNLHQPFQTFSFTPITTGSLELGDLVTITGSGTGYNLITASLGDTTIGTVSELFTEDVIVRPYNKIITSFGAPERLSNGTIGTIWYESGSGQITTSSANNRSQKFLQLTNAVGTSVTGSVDGATFDETSFNFIINDVEVIAQNPGGSSALPIGDITQSINNKTNQHHVTAGIEIEGGNAEVSSGDLAGIGGENGTTKFNVGNNILIVVGSSATLPFNNPSAPGKFEIIVSSGYTLEIHPTTANQIFNGIAYADEFQIASDINAEASAQGAPIQAIATTGTLTVKTTDGSNLEINKISPFTTPNTTDCVGLNSGTGLPTGVFNAPTPEYYLTLSRTDGGQIFLKGTWVTTGGSNQSNGLYNTIGQAPHLLMLEGGSLSSGGADDDWYIGDTFLTASKDVQITGSLLVNRQDSTADFFLIRSGSYDALKVDSQGITRFFAHGDEANPWATADYGGLYYMSSSVWVAID